MVTRACISINNRCNLNCTYCHFHEKKDYIQEDNMDVITILDIITSHIEDNDIDLFKLGFVGNGEPMLDYEKLKQYIAHIGDYLKSGRIAAYTITNGLLVDCEKLEFFKEYNVNVGFSVDGISAIHDKYRCGTHERVIWLTEIKPLLFKIHIGSVVMARQRSSMEIFILAINHFFLKRNYKPRLLTNLKLQR